MKKVKLNCKIANIAYSFPEKILDNKSLAARYKGWDEEKIVSKTGIHTRHISGKNEFVSDLAVKAALNLFRDNKIDPMEIEALILCTQTPDYALPPTSCLIHDRLGLAEKTIVFDYNQGCTGFIYGLSIAGSLIHSGIVENALVITAETYSKWCHPMDKSVTTIFGDGAAATFLKREENNGMGPFIFGSDGKGFKNLTVPVSGAHGMGAGSEDLAEYTDSSGNIRNPGNLYMNGPELFRFAVGTVPSLAEKLLISSGENVKKIDKFVFHQANEYMLRNLQKKMNIPDAKMIYEMGDIGNTVSASIPIAIKMAYDKGKISAGDRLMLIGFGLGYSWGGTMLSWDPEVK